MNLRAIYDIIRLYKIGKELGLTKSEMNKLLLFDDSKHPNLCILLILFLLIFFLIISIFSIITINRYVADSTYARGTRYSTIQIKDFKKKSKKHIK